MPGRPSRQLAPMRVAGFRLLFLSTLASSFGSLLAAIALAIDVKDRTDSAIWVGGVLVVEFLPVVIVGLTLGPLLDRLKRRDLMVAADLLRVAVFCALPFATNAAEIVLLDHGQVVQRGTLADLLLRPVDERTTNFLGRHREDLIRLCLPQPSSTT